MRTLVLAALLAACGPGGESSPPPAAPTAVAAGATPPPEEAPVPAMHPTPFTADQIRDAMPVGTTLRFQRETPDGTGYQTWTVNAVTPTHGTISFQPEAAEGTPLGQASEQTSAWTELRDHALFEVANTTVTDEPVTTEPGAGPGRVYLRTQESRKGPQVSRMHFSLSLPGPPVHMTTGPAGEEPTMTMTLLDRRSP